MNILTIVSFFTGLFNINGAVMDWVLEVLHKILLWLDAVAYTLLAYAFKLFQLMCTLNFNSLYTIISGILTRVEALIMVFVVYKLGITLITFMLNPDEAAKKGKEILINVFITAALLLGYNTIFTLFNELSMLIVGSPENYNYVVLGEIADVTGGKDVGLINRLVFGTNEEIPDIGEYISFSVCSTFITYKNDPSNTSYLAAVLNDNGKKNFYKLTNIAGRIGKDFDMFYVVGFAAACFMIYSVVKTTIQVGIRAFKLLILQIIAPVAIISIIGEGTKGKTFKNFLNKYITVYTELFIRMVSMLLISNFVIKFIRNLGDFLPSFNGEDWWTKALMMVLIIIAAFKFAGDIPKFIDEILGTHLGDGKKFHNFVGGILGGGLGLLAGLGTGTFAGAISGLKGGFQAGAKGNSISEFFKGMSQSNKNARNVAANARMAGGSLRYAGVRAAGALGIPQRRMEIGQKNADRQKAMDDMVKTIEDNYDGKINIGGQELGLTRDLYKQNVGSYKTDGKGNYEYRNSDGTRIYADSKGKVQYKIGADGTGIDVADGEMVDPTLKREFIDSYGFFAGLTSETQEAYLKTQDAYNEYTRAEGKKADMDKTGKVTDETTGEERDATEADYAKAWEDIENTRAKYQTLKASSDKKLDTAFNSKLIAEAREHKNIKDKGRSAVRESIKAYDHSISTTPFGKYKSRRLASGKTNTKEASDKFAKRQDRTTHGHIVSQWNNSNSRGGSSGGSSN